MKCQVVYASLAQGLYSRGQDVGVEPVECSAEAEIEIVGYGSVFCKAHFLAMKEMLERRYSDFMDEHGNWYREIKSTGLE